MNDKYGLSPIVFYANIRAELPPSLVELWWTSGFCAPGNAEPPCLAEAVRRRKLRTSIANLAIEHTLKFAYSKQNIFSFYPPRCGGLR